MRRSKHKMIEEARERNAARGRRSQAVRRNERIAPPLDFEAKPIDAVLLFELATWNPIHQRGHYLELWHFPGSGNGKFVVLLDGERWRNGWSASRFSRWLAAQIGRVRDDWE